MARMPKSVRPRAVVIGLVLENDVLAYDCRKDAEDAAAKEKANGPETRNKTGGIVGFLTRNTALYNLLAVSVKKVAFLREAMIALGFINKEHAYKHAVTETNLKTAVEKTTAEIKRLGAALTKGTPFAVLIIPSRFEIRDGDAFYRTLRQDITAALADSGVAVIDPFDDFRKAGFKPTYFTHDGHWSVLGHKIAGRAVAGWLSRQNIGN
jgi:hypothetical protein